MLWETDAEAARFVNAQDLTSVDEYWFTDLHDKAPDWGQTLTPQHTMGNSVDRRSRIGRYRWRDTAHLEFRRGGLALL